MPEYYNQRTRTSSYSRQSFHNRYITHEDREKAQREKVEKEKQIEQEANLFVPTIPESIKQKYSCFSERDIWAQFRKTVYHKHGSRAALAIDPQIPISDVADRNSTVNIYLGLGRFVAHYKFGSRCQSKIQTRVSLRARLFQD